MAARQLPGRAPGGPPLISMPDIAELAGVRRPVVTAWRRRHIGFPVPAGGGIASPLFDAQQVVDWLVGTGRADRAQIEPELSLHTLAAIGSLFPRADLVAAATALICLRWLDDDEPLDAGGGDIVAALNDRAARLDPDDELLLSEIGQLPRGSGWLAAAIDDLIDAAWGCQGAVERIMAARHRFPAGQLTARAVTPELAWLAARLSGAREHAARSGSLLLADPAAGPADLMTAVVELLGADHLPRCIAAADEAYLARLVRRRLVVHGIPLAEATVSIGTLPDDAGTPDIIVTQVPPGRDRAAGSVLGRIRDVSARLRSDATAVILGPADVLAGGLPGTPAAERARAALLADQGVEAVIRLPDGAAPLRPGDPAALWVLGPARESPGRGRMLLADVSDLELTDDLADELADDVLGWRRTGCLPRPRARALCEEVLVSDLAPRPRRLPVKDSRPASGQLPDGAARVARITQLASEARIDPGAAAAPLRCSIAARSDDRPAVATIGELTRAGRLSMLKGIRLRPAHLHDAGQLGVLGAPELLGHSRPGLRKIDRALLASRYPRARLTEAGDVVVTTVPRLAVFVDHEGSSVPESPARILRIAAAGREQLTPRVLAALLTADAGGLASRARRLGQYRIVLLDRAETERLHALLEQLDQRLGRARQEVHILTEMQNITAAGLLDGTLTLAGAAPDGPSQPESGRG